ncbi:hypothetical protein D3C84_1224810 [compost metagenome]
MHHLRLNLIVERRRRAVQVDIANLVRFQVGFVQRLLNRPNRPFTLRMRCRNMVRIARFADT